MLKNNKRYFRYNYEVNVGGASTMGCVHMPEDATEDDITSEIVAQLYEFSYNVACDSCEKEFVKSDIDSFKTSLAENAKGERILYHICPYCNNPVEWLSDFRPLDLED